MQKVAKILLLLLDPSRVSMFVLDEADEMLSRGFKEQIYDIFRCVVVVIR